jgi:hypothetical protein
MLSKFSHLIKKFSPLALALTSALHMPIYAATSTIRVIDVNGARVSGATVYAVHLGATGPSGADSLIQTSDVNGEVSFTLDDGKAYEMIADKQGLGPTARKQFFDPSHLHVNGNDSTTHEILLNETLANRGTIVAHVTNASPNTFISGSVRKTSDQKPVAFGGCTADNTGTCDVTFNNVNPGNAGTYDVGVYDSVQNRGNGTMVNSALTAGNSVTVNIDIDQGLPPDTSANSGGNNQNQGPQDGATVRGVVVSDADDSEHLTCGHVGLMIRDSGTGQVFDYRGEPVGQDGRFEFRGLQAQRYFMRISGCPTSVNGHYIPGWESDTARTDGSLDTWDFEISNDQANNRETVTHVVELPLAAAGTASLKVKVRQNVSGILGTGIPFSQVNLWPDGGMWNNFGTSLECNGFDSTATNNPGFSQANEQATNGTVVLQNLNPGNYVVSAWTRFSQTPANFNGGPDNEFNWGPGVRGCNNNISNSADDLRLTINNDNSVQVFDINGNDVSNTYVSLENSIPTISVGVVTEANNAAGRIQGTLNFPETADLRNNPIVLIANRCDENGCTGNFAAVGGQDSTPAASYPYEIRVPNQINSEDAQYFVEVVSDIWGVIRTGDDRVVFTDGATDVTRNYNFAPAGSVTGFLYKPDGSPLIPGQTQNGYLSAEIDARCQSSGAHARVNNDGSFTIGGLLPGDCDLFPRIYGGGTTYAAKSDADKVKISVGETATKNVEVVNGVGVAVDVPNFGSLPPPQGEAQNYEVYMANAGNPLSGSLINAVLVHEDEKNSLRYVPLGNGPCGNGWPGGFCPEYKATGEAKDFYLLRRWSIDGGFYQSMTFLGKVENVAISQDNVSNPPVNIQGTPVTPIHVNLPASRTIEGARVGGSVVAENFLRERDFDSFGGDFSNFLKYIIQVVARDANGKILAAGLVTPEPDAIAGDTGAQIDQAVADQDWEAFQQVFSELPFAYQLRGLPTNTEITLIATTPNYPSLVKKVTTGADGSVTTLNLNFDTEVGSGGTIAGTIEDSNGDPIPTASVEIKSPGIEDLHLTVDANGSYSAPGLPQGPFKVSVEADGYASSSKRTVISGAETDTVDFSLTLAPGSITGNVTELSATDLGIVNRPVSGATIVAYDDTINAQNPGQPLSLIKTQTDDEGAYEIKGLITGHEYDLRVSADGRFPETDSVTATGGVVTGIDFELKPLPLVVNLVISHDNENNQFKFEIKNPDNFESGNVYYYNSANAFDVGTAIDISNSFDQLPNGSLVATLADSALDANLIYNLRVDAVPADGGQNVVSEARFGINLKFNSELNIADQMAGDPTEENGVPGNRVVGGDGVTGFDVDPGTILQNSDADLPMAQISIEDGDTAVTDPDAEIYGDVTTITLNDVVFTENPVILNLPVDVNDEDLLANQDDLVLYEVVNGELVQVTDEVAFDPVTGSASAPVNFGDTISAQADIPGGLGGQSALGMSAIRTSSGYQNNPRAAASGSAMFVIGKAQAGGVTSSAYKQYNFPNPFNLKPKTVSLRNGTSGVATSISGTYIVVAPTGSGSVDITIRIYNVAGDMVREFKTPATSGQYNYVEWDGKNSAGDDVASGVYFAAVDAPGAPKKEPIKMVVVK